MDEGFGYIIDAMVGGALPSLRYLNVDSGAWEWCWLKDNKLTENIPLISYVLMPITDDDRRLIGGAAKEAAEKALEWAGIKKQW